MSLRIPLTVTRCPDRDRAGRVRFDHEGDCLIPEEVVLRRWKERSREPDAIAAGVRFDGCRLPSGTWTLLRRWLDDGLLLEDVTDPAALHDRVERSRQSGELLRTPVSTKFAAMTRYLVEKKALRAIVDRDRPEASPGLPDLFLYRVDREGRVHGGRFVEVKRWDPVRKKRERVSEAQRAELDFLKGLGLKARIVYLVETRGPAAAPE
jgi:hypothetical protein